METHPGRTLNHNDSEIRQVIGVQVQLTPGIREAQTITS